MPFLPEHYKPFLLAIMIMVGLGLTTLQPQHSQKIANAGTRCADCPDSFRNYDVQKLEVIRFVYTPKNGTTADRTIYMILRPADQDDVSGYDL